MKSDRIPLIDVKTKRIQMNQHSEILITDYSREEVGGWWQRDTLGSMGLIYKLHIKYICNKGLLYNAGNYILLSYNL